MSDIMAFNPTQDTSVFGRLLYSQSDKPRLVVEEEKAPYLLQSTGTVYNPDLWQLETIFSEFQELIARTQVMSELEIPDVFDLRPQATQRVTLKIREIKPAQFYYVRDVDDDDEE